MRRTGLLVALLAACGGGGGGSVPIAFEQQASFGVVRGDAPTAIQVNVQNPLLSNATAELVQGPQGPFAVEPGALPEDVPDGSALALTLWFTPSGPGDHEGGLRIRFRGNGEEQDVLLDLAAYVETPSVALREPTLYFPVPMYLGESQDLRAYVENRSQATPVAITSLGAAPAGFTSAFAPAVLGPGESLSIKFTYTPESPGAPDFEVPIGHGAGDPLNLRITGRTDPFDTEVTIDFGSVPLSEGKTDWLEVDLIRPSVSLSLEALAEDGVAQPQLIGLEGPGGRVYETEDGTGPLTWKLYASGVFALTIPNSDHDDLQLVPEGGRYRFRFACPGTTLAVRAIVENRELAIADSGVVDLNIFYLSGSGLDPASDSKLGTILANADEILSQVGLRIGDVSYFKIDDKGYDDIGTNEELGELFAESSVAPAARVNVFVVHTLFKGPLFSAAGVAGDVPTPKRNGTNASGIAFDYSLDTGFLGLVVAHEMGHALGLPHVHEDNIDDDDVFDTEYLMNWAWQGSGPPLITPHQGDVILRHPAVDPAPDTLSGISALTQTKVPLSAWLAPMPDVCATCAMGR